MKESVEEKDRRVLELWEQLVEVERRLIPTGLHVFGRASGERESADLLRAVASYDRPERGARALTDLVAEGLGLGVYEKLLADKSEEGWRRRAHLDEVVRDAVEVFQRDGIEQACRRLQEQARVEPGDSLKVFELLADVREQLRTSGELDGLTRSLRGEYVEPGPGADVVQNPSVLPTGRNTHAVNPYAVPSHAAYVRAEGVVNLLLERHRAEHGRLPRTMALVLWGLDNIKTQGEGVAQALRLLGVRPVRDSLNRVTEVEPIPLELLGRARVDVVMTVSGIFRDLFGATMMLLDKAVRSVAALDEPAELNPVRANITERVRCEGCSFDEAQLRVFSNAPGSYGTNVNFMVMDSQWESADALGDLFITRKCFAYGRGPGGRALEGREARGALSRALASVEATYQNVDSFEIGITDVDHYFEYLGGVSRAVERHAQARPAIYLADSLSREARVRTLPEMVRLETRAKTLNPKWYEGMLGHGFRGVAEIESHVTNTFGWSATADAVDGWVYEEVARTYILDAEMLGRLSRLNPHSARSLVARLLEAEGRGFWEADAGVVEKLRDAFDGLEDRIEGVT
jgi:magnesium chelatase subunit H